jgi:hypothetical protein
VSSSPTDDRIGVERAAMVRRGARLEYVTLGWNVVGLVVLAFTALAARSVALAGFGLDSLIEIGASTVVLWELSDTHTDRRPRALRLIGVALPYWRSTWPSSPPSYWPPAITPATAPPGSSGPRSPPR